MSVYARDWVSETSSTHDSVSITLSGDKVTTYASFLEAFGSGVSTVFYSIIDAVNKRESGLGSFDGSTGVLTRTTPYSTYVSGVHNSSSPSRITLQGICTVNCSLPAEGFNGKSHSDLTDLGADDHTQYHNDTRGDARYYTQAQVDARVFNDLGDVVLTTPASGDHIKYSGTNWVNTTFNISDDSTPELGGNLDVGSNQIVSSGSDNIVLNPAGGGHTYTYGINGSIGFSPIGTYDTLILENATNSSNMLMVAGSGSSSIKFALDGDTQWAGRILFSHNGVTDRLGSFSFAANGAAGNQFTIEEDYTLTVGDTTNYETLVTDDDDIPNKKYVDDAVSALNDENYVINGGFEIWQKDTTFSVTSGASNEMTADRWLVDFPSGWTTVTVSKDLFTLGQTDVPGEPEASLKVVTTGSHTSPVTIRTKIEDVRKLAGESAVLSFWAKAATAVSTDTALLVQQRTGSGGSPTSNTIYNSNISYGTSWTYYEIPLTFNSLSGATIGTGHRIQIDFDLGLVANTIRLSNVKLQGGTVATEYKKPDIATQMSVCQRYYWNTFDKGVGVGDNNGYNGAISLRVASGDNAGRAHTAHPTRMYTAPTVTTYNPGGGSAGQWRNASDTTDATVGASPTIGEMSTSFGLSGGTSGQSMYIHAEFYAEVVG